MNETRICPWAAKTEIERTYHDSVWGSPMHGDRELFKMLCLEGMQAGLSWLTILRKMESMCALFDDFDPSIVATYGEDKVESLLCSEGLIKNRLKIRAVITNAQAYHKLCQECGSLDSYLWAYVDGVPIQNVWSRIEDVPAKTELSDKISKDLKRRGFKFVGSVIIYAFMQAIGMVNDHLTTCPRHEEVKTLG